MKKLTFMLLVSVCFYSCQKEEEIETSGLKASTPIVAAIANSWEPKSPVGTRGSSTSTAFNIGNKGYLILGLIGSHNLGSAKDVLEFNPVSGSWTKKSDFPSAGYSVFSFVIGNKAYVGATILNVTPDDKYEITKELWEYDPANDAWTKKTHYPGAGIWGIVGFSIGGEGFAGTGLNKVSTDIPDDNDDEYHRDFWKYNPLTDNWSRITNFPGCPRAYATAFVINGIAYVGTGTTHYSNKNTKDFYKYNPSTNIWTQIADFGGDERAYMVSFTINGKGYAGTGSGKFYTEPFGFTNEYNDFWEYNPLTNQWNQKADFAGGLRTFAIGLSIGNKGYIGLGIFEIDVLKTDFWEYTPD